MDLRKFFFKFIQVTIIFSYIYISNNTIQILWWTSILKAWDSCIVEVDSNYISNFNEESINKYFQDTVDLVCKLFLDHFHHGSFDVNGFDNNNTSVIVQSGNTNIESIDSDDDSLNQLVNNKLKNDIQVFGKTKNMIQEIDLTTNIEREMKEYRNEMVNLDIPKYMEQFGNDKYKKLKQNLEKKNDKLNSNHEKLDKKKISNDSYNINYIISLSNVLMFWKENQIKYKYLSTAALISLGKPTHNAFQERVFSRGTYQDHRLKKRLLEDSFEISVLNAINNRHLTKIDDTINCINEKYEIELSNKNKMMVQCNQLKAFVNVKNNEKINIKEDESSDNESDYECESDNDVEKYYEEYNNNETEIISESIKSVVK